MSQNDIPPCGAVLLRHTREAIKSNVEYLARILQCSLYTKYITAESSAGVRRLPVGNDGREMVLVEEGGRKGRKRGVRRVAEAMKKGKCQNKRPDPASSPQAYSMRRGKATRARISGKREKSNIKDLT